MTFQLIKYHITMKKLALVIGLIISLLGNTLFAQRFTQLKNGEDSLVNGMIVSYNVVKKQTKKGNDLYRLTATVTNQENNYFRLFSTAQDFLVEETKNAFAYFQFTNATGKALSNTSAYFYPSPVHIKVPYECEKCPPLKKDEDPNEYYTKSVIIGTEFPVGSTLSKVYNIRVPEGEEPTVRVMIY